MCSRQAGCSGTVQDDLKRSTYIYKTAGVNLWVKIQKS
jgi:hypothetical protein